MKVAEADGSLHVVAASLAQRLHLQAARAGDGRIAILLDQTREPLHDEERLAWSEADAVLHTVRIHHSEVAWERCPMLAEIDSASFAGSQAVAESSFLALQELEPQQLLKGNGRRISCWWLCDESYDRLALHLARSMLQTRPGGATVWLRLQDPRVLWALWPLLGPAQQGSLLGPASRAFLLDPAGRLQALERSPGARKGNGVPLRLSAAQWIDLDNIEALQQMLSYLDVKALPDLEPVRRTAMAAMRRARAVGLHDRSDLAAFAHKAVVVHPVFDRHPRIAALLAQRQPDDYFTALIDELADGDWQRIAHEMDGSSVSSSSRY